MAIDKKKLVTLEKGKELFDNYTKGNYDLINSQRLKLDSRSYWYSIEELENYISYLKENIPQLNPKKVGVRIFMGTYGEGEELEGKNVSGYQTVFMYPSMADETNLESNSFSSISEDIGYNRGKMSPPL